MRIQDSRHQCITVQHRSLLQASIWFVERHGMGHLSFQEIRRQYGITIHQVANIAGIEPREEYLFEIGARMDQQRAENIVSALNTLTGEHYTLADFRAPVTEQPTTPLPTLPIRRISWPKHSRST